MYMNITVVYYSNVNKYKWNGMNKREGGERGRGRETTMWQEARDMTGLKEISSEESTDMSHT